jgi:ATP-dependent DNA ligase
VDLFREVCARDLEGIVAKWKHGPYLSGDQTSWVKIKNPAYSQSWVAGSNTSGSRSGEHRHLLLPHSVRKRLQRRMRALAGWSAAFELVPVESKYSCGEGVVVQESAEALSTKRPLPY